MKYKNKTAREECKMRFNQVNLGAIYESAKRRIKAHPYYAKQQEEILKNCPVYEDEKNAVDFALKLPREDMGRCKIWVDVVKDEEFYSISKKRWLVAYDGATLKAAEYLGMTVLYDVEDFLDILKREDILI